MLISAGYICRMEVNEALVTKLAHLSRLEFNKEEKIAITDDLRKMISFVEKLGELDLEGVEPLIHISEEVNVFRTDTIEGELDKVAALKNSPVPDTSFFKVPKVMRK